MSVIEMKTIVEIVFWVVDDSMREFESITLCDFPDLNFPNQGFSYFSRPNIIISCTCICWLQFF